MRIIVFFDLPVVEAKHRKIYMKFRNFLIKDGYDMMQFSVYVRLCNSHEAVEKHMKRLNGNIPEEGSIRVLSITEKQYASMKILVGEVSKQEKKNKTNQIMLF